MYKIRGNRIIQDREKIEKHTKYQVLDRTASHLVKVEKKKLYDYYICDYCGAEIKVNKKWEERTGGVMILPASLTKAFPLKVVLCNKCILATKKEFEEEANK